MSLDFFRTPGPMTALPDDPRLGDVPTDLDEMRRVVQGLLLHRDWAPAYGVPAEEIRIAEQNLRSTPEVLARALELSPTPITTPREPVDRVLGICRHFTLLHTAFLRSHGVPARVRCGFGHYFDRTKWFDHWITERWDGDRWVRDDPQIDEIQADVIELDFDPYDQPPGQFLSGAEAWRAARDGEVDPGRFGILDMWGLAFIGGNVLNDFACLNKVELLPWDAWGMGLTWGPYDELPEDTTIALDGIAELVLRDDFASIRDRYQNDERVRVPSKITSFVGDEALTVHLEL